MRHPRTQRDPAKPLQGNRISHLPAQRLIAQPGSETSKTSNRRYVSIGIDGRANVTDTEPGIERREEHRIIQQCIHPTNSAGNTNNSGGKIASHNVGWSFTVLSTMASIPSSPSG
jgi:hypothetical protein